MHLHKYLHKIALTVFCVLLMTGAAYAQDIKQVKYVNLLGVPSWVLAINSDGTVEWNDGSDGQTFTDPDTFLNGEITSEQWQALTAMLETAGYTKERPFEGVEPKLRVTMTLTDGTSFTNFGPTTMDDEAVAAFIPIEKFFNDLALSLGAPDVYTFYKLD